MLVLKHTPTRAAGNTRTLHHTSTTPPPHSLTRFRPPILYRPTKRQRAGTAAAPPPPSATTRLTASEVGLRLTSLLAALQHAPTLTHTTARALVAFLAGPGVAAALATYASLSHSIADACARILVCHMAAFAPCASTLVQLLHQCGLHSTAVPKAIAEDAERLHLGLQQVLASHVPFSNATGTGTGTGAGGGGGGGSVTLVPRSTGVVAFLHSLMDSRQEVCRLALRAATQVGGGAHARPSLLAHGGGVYSSTFRGCVWPWQPQCAARQWPVVLACFQPLQWAPTILLVLVQQEAVSLQGGGEGSGAHGAQLWRDVLQAVAAPAIHRAGVAATSSSLHAAAAGMTSSSSLAATAAGAAQLQPHRRCGLHNGMAMRVACDGQCMARAREVLRLWGQQLQSQFVLAHGLALVTAVRRVVEEAARVCDVELRGAIAMALQPLWGKLSEAARGTTDTVRACSSVTPLVD